MGRSMLTLKDPEKIAINNRLGKIIRFLGEHTINKEWLVENYGDDNPILAMLDDDPAKEISLIEAMSLGAFSRAMKGDIRALEFIRDTIGEKPATQVNINTEQSTTFASLTTAQLLEALRLRDGDKTPPDNKSEVIDVEPEDDNDSTPFDEDNPDE